MITPFQFQQMQIRLGTPEPSDFRCSSEEMAEAYLHNQIKAECAARLWPFVHSRMDKHGRATVGSPDFVIAADRGRTIWVECKSADGKISSEQRIFIAMAKKLGTIIHVVRTLDQFLEVVK